MNTSFQTEILLPSQQFQADIDFFLAWGFRLDQIFPADDPQIARMSGYGIHLCIDRNLACSAPTLRLPDDAGQPENETIMFKTAPNGTNIVLGDTAQTLPTTINKQLEISSTTDKNSPVAGRAGMLYRDLIPSRLGGQIIASHISIPEGGPVADMVHYHVIEFQLIYCYRGWVKVVYEDQGEPFTLRPGDCVTQPPGIRHRVLESSDQLEVIEIGIPALHMTNFDHDIELPTNTYRPERDFGGQLFCHHIANDTPWRVATDPRFLERCTGVHIASRGVANVKALRPDESKPTDEDDINAIYWYHQQADIVFYFVMEGELTLTTKNKLAQSTVHVEETRVKEAPVKETHQFDAGDSIVIPAGQDYCFHQFSADLMLLEFSLT